MGIVLIIAAIILIFWNEKHSLHMAESLQEAQKILVTVPNSPINPQNNSKVVYFTGLATTTDKLIDSTLGVDVNAINLDRKVEMYQWEEHVKTETQSQMGGSEKQIKTYNYTKTWSDNLIDSSNFKDQEGHQNPTSMPVESRSQYAEKVTVGDFILPRSLLSEIDVSKPIELTEANKDKLKAKLNKPVELVNNQLYVGADPQNPQLGDLKITSTVVYPQDVSIIAQQSGTTIQPYLAPAGESIMLLTTGTVSSIQMIRNALDENKMLAWILRGVSLLMLVIGFSLLLGPLVALADVLPFLGSIVGFGTGFIGFVLGLAVWVIATSIAWFATRPILAVGITAVVLVLSYMLIKMKQTKRV
ncbi:TMEM43 family protein [Legionella sp. km772]|uniref:TMEM43 family protein n=1 Tax=Legionella sp. km772 TaxID=2498111 RepID=UPI001F3E2EE3|nr:TMEM43 family protein [Legionella sp. km772]